MDGELGRRTEAKTGLILRNRSNFVNEMNKLGERNPQEFKEALVRMREEYKRRERLRREDKERFELAEALQNTDEGGRGAGTRTGAFEGVARPLTSPIPRKTIRRETEEMLERDGGLSGREST